MTPTIEEQELKKNKEQQQQGAGVVSPAAGSLKDTAQMIATAVIEGAALFGKWVRNSVYQTALKELTEYPQHQDGIRDSMIGAWLNYQQCIIDEKLRFFPMTPERFFGDAKWRNSKLWDLELAIKESKTWTGQTLERQNYLVEAVDWAFTADEQIEWLVEGVIQVSANGIIAAEPKTGKSLAALDLLLSMACGVKWLGCKAPRRVRCAYISREDSPVRTKVRIQALLRGKGIPTDLDEHLRINTWEQLGNFDIDDEEQLIPWGTSQRCLTCERNF